MTDLTGFGVALRWCTAKAGGNRVPNLTQLEQADLEKIDGQEFPQTLVLDCEEFDRFWLSVVLLNVNPPVSTPIGLEFQINEPSWVGFTYEGTFFSLSILTF